MPSAISSRRASALDRVAVARAISQMVSTDGSAAQAGGPCPEVSSDAPTHLGVDFPPSEGEPTSLLGSRTRTLSVSSLDSWSLTPEVNTRTTSGELVAREDDRLVVDAAPNTVALPPKDSALVPAAAMPEHDANDPANAFPAPDPAKEQVVLKSPSGECSEAAAANTGEIVPRAVPTNDSTPAPGGNQGTASDTAQTRPQGTASGIGLGEAIGSSGSSAKNPAPESNPTAVSSDAEKIPEALSSPDHSPVLSAPRSRKASSTTPPRSP